LANSIFEFFCKGVGIDKVINRQKYIKAKD